jgi:hypothetical protein
MHSKGKIKRLVRSLDVFYDDSVQALAHPANIHITTLVHYHICLT